MKNFKNCQWLHDNSMPDSEPESFICDVCKEERDIEMLNIKENFLSYTWYCDECKEEEDEV